MHGDDFTAARPKYQLDWFEAKLKENYELTVGGRLGPGAAYDKEARVLNRMIRWTSQGFEYEADPRQVEKLLEELHSAVPEAAWAGLEEKFQALRRAAPAGPAAPPPAPATLSHFLFFSFCPFPHCPLFFF